MSDNNTDGEPEIDATTQSEPIVREIGESDRPTEVVVRAVAALTNTEILDLDPLYDTIDPVHVDKLTDSRGESAIEDSTVLFRYNGCLITINQNTVHVRTDAG